MSPERIQELLQILWDSVKSNEDLEQFISTYGRELDEGFMEALGTVAQSAKENGNDIVARFFEQMGQVLQQVFPNSGDAPNGPLDEFAQITAEDDAIRRAMDTNPNEAYERARANLERALLTQNDTLIMRCAFKLGYSAMAYSPCPKLEDAIEAFLVSAEKARAIADSDAYAATQNNLGNVYFDLPTGDRAENLRKAIACFENALRVYSEADSPTYYAVTQNNLGNTWAKLPQGDRAENLRNSIACYENALRVYSEEDFPQSYIMTQNNLGNAWSNLPTGDRAENLRRSRACYENALRACRKEDYPQDYAATQNNLGAAHFDMPAGDRSENLRKAIACFENASRVYGLEDYPQSYAMTQNNLGAAYFDLQTGNRTENLRKAIACFENALKVYSEEDYPQSYAVAQNSLGAAYSNLPVGDRSKNLRKAIACYENASRVYGGEDYPQSYYAMTQNNLGAAWSKLTTGDRAQNLAKAIACYENALRGYTAKDDPQGYGVTQNNLGAAWFKLTTGDRAQNLAKAIACYENALEVYGEQSYPQDYAMTQNNLGNAWARLLTGDPAENLEKAITCYENALSVYGKEDYPQDYAMTQNNLGNVYSELPSGDPAKNLEKAITCYENALEVYGEQDYPKDYAMIQNNLGNASYRLQTGKRTDNLRKSISCYENALRVRTTEELPQERADTMHNLALACDDALADLKRAYRACAEAIEIMEKHVRTASSVETRRAIADTRAGVYHHMVSLCVRLGKPAEALSYAERGKSRTLVEMLHWAQLQPPENVPKETRNSFVAARAKLEELHDLRQKEELTTPRDFEIGEDAKHRMVFRAVPVMDSSPQEDIWKLRGEVQGAYNLLLEEIRKADPEFAASERVQILSASDIEAMVPERTLFVDCFTGYDGTFVFTLGGKADVGNEHLLLKDLTYAELFERLVFQSWLEPYYNLFDCFTMQEWLHPYHTFMEKKATEAEQAWLDAIENTPRLLAEKFWHACDERGRSLARIVEQSGAERIVFFPHSGLHLLPLHLMPLSKDDPAPRLMDRYEVVYAPSASILRFVLNRPDHLPKRLLAVANPDRSLNFADNEIRTISSHFDQHQVLWHEEATREVVLTESAQANIVHFSCHGSFAFKNSLDSHLVLAGNDKLSLREIFSKLKLPRAGAVLLPACETGMVQLELGDEYIGLASGFLHAGAHSVISSLWAVNDLSTSLLMQRWYENVLTHKLGKAAALREAQQWVRDLKAIDICTIIDALIKKTQEQPDKEKELFFKIRRKIYRDMPDDEHPFEHPYYWGGFVCTGNWN